MLYLNYPFRLMTCFFVKVAVPPNNHYQVNGLTSNPAEQVPSTQQHPGVVHGSQCVPQIPGIPKKSNAVSKLLQITDLFIHPFWSKYGSIVRQTTDIVLSSCPFLTSPSAKLQGVWKYISGFLPVIWLPGELDQDPNRCLFIIAIPCLH